MDEMKMTVLSILVTAGVALGIFIGYFLGKV